jgi:hypothetical protein
MDYILKKTSNGSERQFSFIVGAQVRPACTTKNAQRLIFCCSTKKALYRGVGIYDFAGKKINEKAHLLIAII